MEATASRMLSVAAQQFAEKGYFLSGGYCKLPMTTSKAINMEDIKEEHCFDIGWLKKQDKLGLKQQTKLSVGQTAATILDFITPC